GDPIDPGAGVRIASPLPGGRPKPCERVRGRFFGPAAVAEHATRQGKHPAAEPLDQARERRLIRALTPPQPFVGVVRVLKTPGVGNVSSPPSALDGGWGVMVTCPK